MISKVDGQFRAEARQYRLRLACEDCAHFAADTNSCGNGYPVAEHRALDLDGATVVVFCKQFELG
jgi:hypothetical protein